jgi:CSLREA domain-containing protein
MTRRWIAVALVVGFAGPARAVDFQVASLVDAPDAVPGDGVCVSLAGGTCTLRAAVQEANALPGPDRILLGAGTHLLSPTLPDDDAAAVGDLDVTDDLHVIGLGVDVSSVAGGDAVRIFQVRHAGSFAIERASLRDGDGGASAGAIDSLAGAQILVTRAELSSNQGGNGGAIGLIGGSLMLFQSTLADNNAGAGGAVFALDADVTIEASTLSGNQAQSLGGGVHVDNGALIARNTTLAGNSAGSVGGGIHLWNNDGSASVNLAHVTLAGNSAALAGGGIATQSAAAASVRIGRSVLAANTPAGCSLQSGALVSSGFSVAEDASCGLTAAGDLVVSNAQLATLGFFGGPTHTRPPLAGSAAIDRILGVCLATDQRGVPRPQDGDTVSGAKCDAGAVEVAVDGDGDGTPDPIDNCPELPNDQSDVAGLGSGSAPDGIGDACQCGDGDDDGTVADSDAAALRAQLAGAAALSPAGLSKCSVIGGPDCDVADWVALARALDEPPLAPGVAQTCYAAISP